MQRTDAPVVGIGASAGGLEPLGELLAALPAGTGMVFLVVQHLDPGRASLLVEILGKKTSMPVAEAQDGMSILPDHVYIIPPNALLSLSGDALHLVPRIEGRHPPMPVDVLFLSLAKERGEQAVGVVLSGTGSDGSRGVQAIKEAGGITLAQEEISASFSGMPKSAIETGCVDFILPAAEMAETLARIGRHPYLKTGAGAKTPDESSARAEPGAPADKATTARLFRLLRASSGVDFTHYKRATIDRRLARRMALHHLDDLPSYVDLLHNDPSEVQVLSQDLLIVVTSFFRDPGGLEALSRLVFPALMEERSPKDPVRVWVPGCASGEEVYSIAISLLEFLGERSTATPIQIFGTDVSEPAIERARAGSYPESIAAEVSPERLRRFFLKHDGRYQIAKSIREMCVFARQDVTRDPPFSRLDLVSCCNLLIYLDQALQRRVLSLFHYALKSRGFLMLGPSESVGESADLFESMDKRYRIYARKAVSGHKGLLFDRDQDASSARQAAEGTAAAPDMLETERIQREADRVLLARYAPACVLIDEDLNVLQFRGQTGPYLEHVPGPASLNLRKLAAPALLIALGRAMEEARRTGVPARTAALRLETPGAAREIWLQVSPVQVPEAGLHGYLVAFEETQPERSGKPAQSMWGALLGWSARLRAAGAQAPGEETERARLQRELAATRDYLQTAIEAHEAAKEELKSAHEELLSANEELQSTNEELQTSKEELESTNEELITTNDELTNRNREMASLNEALRASGDYAEAIVQTTPTPLLVLDASLHVMKANHAFYETFRTRAEDTEGRYIHDLGDRDWEIAELRTALRKVLPEDGRFSRFEVRHAFKGLGEKIMLLGAQRLPGNRNRPEMVLLSMEDDTERKHAEEALAEANRHKDEFLAMLAHELRNPLAPMRLAAETMRTIGSADPTVTFGAAVIDRQVAHLARLVDDLLDVSRINRGMIAVQKTRIALDEVIGAALEISRPLIEEREHHLAVVEEPRPIYLDGDADRLAQVVSNLLNNAAKFTPKGGEIALSTHIEGNEALIRVRDSGAGIAPELLPHVFDLFFQAEASHGRGFGGMGIGLALARRLVELHRGSIQARSEGRGKGAEFVVRLPRHDQAPARTPGPQPAGEEPAASARYRILVVDDNVDAAKMTQMFLRAHGHEVRCAFDGLSAISLAREFQPQLVLLDIAMPGMDGYEVLRRLREQAGAAQPVVAAVTGFGWDTTSERMKQLGLDRYIVKPAAPQALLDLIASLK
ncbi:MAG TPA: chemotaxis protein CheB [Burkholderiales bacterium]